MIKAQSSNLTLFQLVIWSILSSVLLASDLPNQQADRPLDETDTSNAERLKSALNNKRLYEIDIEKQQSVGDVYNIELSESYMGLGYAHRNLGQHEDAAKSFARALQVVRVSEGLDSSRQLAVLEQLLQTNIDLEQWQSVSGNYHLMYYLNTRNYNLSDARRIRSLDRLAQWNIRAIAEELITDSPIELLEESSRLYADAIGALHNADDLSEQEKVSIFLNQADVQLNLANFNMSVLLQMSNGNIGNGGRTRISRHTHNTLSNGRNDDFRQNLNNALCREGQRAQLRNQRFAGAKPDLSVETEKMRYRKDIYDQLSVMGDALTKAAKIMNAEQDSTLELNSKLSMSRENLAILEEHHKGLKKQFVRSRNSITRINIDCTDLFGGDARAMLE